MSPIRNVFLVLLDSLNLAGGAREEAATRLAAALRRIHAPDVPF
jgi:hypothetical protein